MRRLATLGLVVAAGLGGGCAAFDEWMEPEHCAEYRRGGYQPDGRTGLRPDPREAAEDGPGVYPDR